jgi:hypothetical protein
MLVMPDPNAIRPVAASKMASCTSPSLPPTPSLFQTAW